MTAQVSKANGSTWGSETYSIADVIDANGDFRFVPEQTSIVFPRPVLEITERVFT